MQVAFIGCVQLDTKSRLDWIWHSSGHACFVAGNHKAAFIFPNENPQAFDSLNTEQDKGLSFLLLPEPYLSEMQNIDQRGFSHLDFRQRIPNESRRALEVGGAYGVYFRHPASQLILGLRARTMQLLAESDNELKLIDEVRVRGGFTLNFCAHPSEAFIVYGDNHGDFYAHHFSSAGFGKTRKIASYSGNANAVEFISPQTLLAGGTGYLAAFEYKEAKFKLLHSLSAIPVRDFIWHEAKNLLIVNQGIHGIAVFSLTDTGFLLADTLKPPFPVDKMAVSACGTWIGFSSQMYSILGIAKIEYNS